MSRKRAATKRKILPDPKFGSELVAKFINVIMGRGKKAVAEKIVYGALDGQDDPVGYLQKVLDTVRPTVEVRSRRIGGATYQIPVEVPPVRGIALAMRWLKKHAKKRSENTMAERLAKEMVDALQGRGETMKARENAHKMAEANKAFAHFRW
jgi:small subunit ribosomal protein S7